MISTKVSSFYAGSIAIERAYHASAEAQIRPCRLIIENRKKLTSLERRRSREKSL
jgi:hypothetical protein